jgi:hypothetical protein
MSVNPSNFQNDLKCQRQKKFAQLSVLSGKIYEYLTISAKDPASLPAQKIVKLLPGK